MNLDLSPELEYSASRSSGAGGQNVNKVNTKVEVRFNVAASQILTEEQKAVLLQKLAIKLSGEGYLIVVAQTERSQLKNKEIATYKLYEIIRKALIPIKRRRATRPTLGSKERRLDIKRQISDKKRGRSGKDFN
jgi:ribosome-associated protein